MTYRILSVEDDNTIREQLKNLLTGNGYLAAAVEDFSDVIGQVKVFSPHLVLLDIRLPGENGFALCSRIRAFSDLPIIFVTSSNMDMDELNSIMLGGDAFITKPYNTAILLAKIASLLKRAKGGADLERGRAAPGEQHDYLRRAAGGTDEKRGQKLSAIGLKDFIRTKLKTGICDRKAAEKRRKSSMEKGEIYGKRTGAVSIKVWGDEEVRADDSGGIRGRSSGDR